jgi:plastocyanin
VASLTPMTRRISITFVLATVAISMFGACGSSSGGGSSAKCPAKVDTKTATGGAITVCASDIKYDVKTIKAQPGSLKITLENDGAIYHTMKISNTDLQLKVNAGKSATGTVSLSKGTYDFDCTVPGHAAAGMKGTIEVG